jgi:hypothetical protein
MDMDSFDKETKHGIYPLKQLEKKLRLCWLINQASQKKHAQFQKTLFSPGAQKPCQHPPNAPETISDVL